MTTFQELGIRPALCDVLRSHGIKEATPVQEKAMPLVRAGHDCIVKAQTGTGKTLAFLLPIIEKLKPQAEVAQALVVTPTRELAIQIPRWQRRSGRPRAFPHSSSTAGRISSGRSRSCGAIHSSSSARRAACRPLAPPDNRPLASQQGRPRRGR